MAINCSIDLPVMAAVATGEKLTKTGSIFMGRDRGIDRGSARLRGMVRGSAGARFKGMGRGQSIVKVHRQG